MKTVSRYTRWIRFGEQWDTDSGIVHADTGRGRTYCGREIGTLRTGWERFWRNSQPTCKHCLRQIERFNLQAQP